MTLLPHPRADEHAALQFEDLASALDSGLLPTQIGGRANAGERVVHELLRDRGVRLSATEDAVLTAAWRAGRMTPALQERARSRRQRAEFGAELRGRLRYPLVLILFVMVQSLVVAVAFHAHGMLLLLAIAIAATIGGVALLLRGLQHGGDRWERLPLLGPLAAELAELPYLETLLSLYSAGIPLADAHPMAVRTSPTRSMRDRLQRADQLLQDRRPLAEALYQTGSLHDETRQLLATGERSGDLEGALRRAWQRRAQVTARKVTAVARFAGIAVYAIAATLVACQVFAFYTFYFGLLRGIGSR